MDRCINCGGDGSKLLGILSASLRGTVTSALMADRTPSAHPGCDEMRYTSHGLFAVCPSLFPSFPDVGAWDVQAPNKCIPCRKAWDHFGDAFDFFSLRAWLRLDPATSGSCALPSRALPCVALLCLAFACVALPSRTL